MVNHPEVSDSEGRDHFDITCRDILLRITIIKMRN